MKKTVLVTITKEIEVDIIDELLAPARIEEFSAYMFPIYSVDELFEHAAQYVARFDRSFVEGIGNVSYTELLEDVTTEIVA